MNASIQVLSNRFPELEGHLESVRLSAMRAGVTTLVATAAPLTPVDTGALRANVSMQVGPDEATVTWNQHYAAYVHEGTYKMQARPFARTAMPAATDAVRAELGRFGG